jgi:hypothetical protein
VAMQIVLRKEGSAERKKLHEQGRTYEQATRKQFLTDDFDHAPPPAF